MVNDKEKITKIALTAIFIAGAFISSFIASPVFSSAEHHRERIQVLEDKKATAMGLTTATAVASTAITMLPDDAATPIATQISELSSALLIVTCVLYLEKFLLTTAGYATFTYIFPLALLLAAACIWKDKLWMRNLAIKLAIFGLAVYMLVPVSIKVTTMIEDTFQQSIDQTFSAVEEINEIAEEDTTTEKNFWQKVSSAFNNFGRTVANGVEMAKNILSLFVDAIAVLIITTCVIPIVVLIFFIWLIKIIFGINIPVPAPHKRLPKNLIPPQIKEE